jgi:hypothetical protein
MKTYDVTVSRDGKWWMIHIPDLDGLTQSRRLGEIEDMARDYIAVVTDVPLSQVAVRVSGIDVAGQDLVEIRTLIDELREQARQAEAAVARLAEQVAVALVASRVPMRDVSEILGVSHQRVSQLVQASESSRSSKVTMTEIEVPRISVPRTKTARAGVIAPRKRVVDAKVKPAAIAAKKARH